MNSPVNHAGILLGSNIEPEKNLILALKLLADGFGYMRFSSAWESLSVGFNGPNYLNAAIIVETPLDAQALNQLILRPLEDRLGRVRQEDKYVPRTIDLDIVTWNQDTFAKEIWKYAHAAIPTSQLLPDLRVPQTGETLSEIAQRLAQTVWVLERADVLNQAALMV
ncbi:MAG: 2-amino-4-hydroxy-6-hydroxymethyldihydropteridine diphosphokinase [Chloroflexi bacterium RBG_16_54_18]|nr:MAG: 2-amino-4-hydroxy-6-hydroxymethyldihydropteridine diphosphokinase [Chloroflexi bacterium RBG_16_54_18]